MLKSHHWHFTAWILSMCRRTGAKSGTSWAIRDQKIAQHKKRWDSFHSLIAATRAVDTAPHLPLFPKNKCQCYRRKSESRDLCPIKLLLLHALPNYGNLILICAMQHGLLYYCAQIWPARLWYWYFNIGYFSCRAAHIVLAWLLCFQRYQE